GGDEEVTRTDVHRADDELERKQAAVLPLAHRLVGAARWQVELEPPLQVVDEAAAVGGGDEGVDRLADQLFFEVAEELDYGRVCRLDDACAVERRQAIGDVVEDRE